MKEVKSFFDITSNILRKSGDIKDVPGFSKNMSAFMILRHLSCEVKFIEFVKIGQEISKSITANQLYDWLYKVIPKTNVYIKYDIGKTKKTKGELK